MGFSFKKIAKWALPGIGGKLIGHAIFKDKKKKPGAIDEGLTPEQAQAQLDTILKEYETVDADTLSGATERAKTAGTYSPSTAFNEQLSAEAGAASRQIKDEKRARANALRRFLKQPESPTGTI